MLSKLALLAFLQSLTLRNPDCGYLVDWVWKVTSAINTIKAGRLVLRAGKWDKRLVGQVQFCSIHAVSPDVPPRSRYSQPAHCMFGSATATAQLQQSRNPHVISSMTANLAEELLGGGFARLGPSGSSNILHATIRFASKPLSGKEPYLSTTTPLPWKFLVVPRVDFGRIDNLAGIEVEFPGLG